VDATRLRGLQTASVQGRRGRGGEGWGGVGVRPRGRTQAFVRMLLPSVRTYAFVHADAPIYPRGNFITDATVCPSHGRPNGHCPIVHPSVHPSSIVHVTTLGDWRSGNTDCLKECSAMHVTWKAWRHCSSVMTPSGPNEPGHREQLLSMNFGAGSHV
jgi:hypothetical protein